MDNRIILDDQLTNDRYEVDEYGVFLVKSFRENLAINMALIFVFALALALSMLLLPHMLIGLTWDGA